MKPAAVEECTDLAEANRRIQELSRLLRVFHQQKQDYINTSEAYNRFHSSETARYRKIASDATEKLFRQYRESARMQVIIMQIQALLASSSTSDPPADSGNIPAAVDSCLGNAASLQTERELQKILEHLTNVCKDAGLPVAQAE